MYKKEYEWALSNPEDPDAKVLLALASIYAKGADPATLAFIEAVCEKSVKRWPNPQFTAPPTRGEKGKEAVKYPEWLEQVKKVLSDRATHWQVVESITVDESEFFQDLFEDGYTPNEAADDFEESLR